MKTIKMSVGVCEVAARTMSKFKVLRYNQAFMAELGIYSHRLTEPTNEFFNCRVTYTILGCLLVAILSNCVLVYIDSTNSKSTLESVVLIVTSFQAFGAYLNIGLKMKKMKELHLKLQEISDEGDLNVLLESLTILLNRHLRSK